MNNKIYPCFLDSRRGRVKSEKKIILTITSIFLMTGCASTNTMVKKGADETNVKIEALEKKVKELEIENSEMKISLDNVKKEKEKFSVINHMAVDFVIAQSKGDIASLQKLLSDEIKIVNNGDSYFIADDVLYSKTELGIYKYMVVQSYEYIPKDDIYKINIKQIYEDRPQQIANKIPVRYLNLSFKEVNGAWKIFKLNFDV